ncbi:MAG: hypothetical protein GXP25_06425 [Planctomycetes bacterium]|nr:hypothetical protein [Planctomycetota bacterium]
MKEDKPKPDEKAQRRRRAIWIIGVGLVAAFVVAGGVVVTQPWIVNGLLAGASAAGNTEVARLCLLLGADPDAKEPGSPLSGQPTPLQCAAFAGRLDVVELLLSYGADAKARDGNGWTALHWACLGGPQNVEGANAPLAPASQTPPDRFRQVARALIEHGADVNAKDEEGGTPLHRAAAIGLKKMVDFLLAAGADVKAKRTDGCTPLHAAARGGHAEVASLLIEKGADVNAKSQSGRTPLHWAAEAGKRRMVEILVAKGADVHAKDTRGATAEDMAYGEQIKTFLRGAQ